MRGLLVTGGAGFIGANFIHYWREQHGDDRIVCLDALTYAGNLDNLSGLQEGECYRFVQGRIEDAGLVGRLLRKENIDTVVNFAAESHVDRSISGPEAFIRSNIQGTYSLLEATRAAWSSRRDGCRFIQVSTDEVYGSLESAAPAFTEQNPYAPTSPYAASKASADHLVRAWFRTYGLPVLITNCSNNYGPRQFPEKLIPLVIIAALEGRPLPVYGDGGNVRDWLHVEDHCSGIDAVLERGVPGETYNIGSCNEWANLDIVRQVCRTLDEMRPADMPYESLITHVEDRPGHDRRYAIDAGKLMRTLGWAPSYSFETGIRQTVRWYLDNPEWVARTTGGQYRDYYRQRYGDV